jgi:hypothetical protein
MTSLPVVPYSLHSITPEFTFLPLAVVKVAADNVSAKYSKAAEKFSQLRLFTSAVNNRKTTGVSDAKSK